MENRLPTGVYAATLIPLFEDLTIDHEELASHSFDLVNRGCRGIALFGTTGEGPSFSLKERLSGLEALLSKGFDPKKIILVNGSSGISDTVELARAVLKHGCAALLAAPPCYYKHVAEEGVIAYYEAIIERAADPKLPLLLYHYPQLTGVPITLPIIDSLRTKFPHAVIGLKESGGDLDFTRSILARFPNFQVFVGNELQIIEACRCGGAGSICGMGNLYPEWVSSLYEEPATARVEELRTLFQALKGIPFIPAAKAIMEQRRGPKWHAICPPLMPLGEEERHSLYEALQVSSVQ